MNKNTIIFKEGVIMKKMIASIALCSAFWGYAYSDEVPVQVGLKQDVAEVVASPVLAPPSVEAPAPAPQEEIGFSIVEQSVKQLVIEITLPGLDVANMDFEIVPAKDLPEHLASEYAGYSHCLFGHENFITVGKKEVSSDDSSLPASDADLDVEQSNDDDAESAPTEQTTGLNVDDDEDDDFEDSEDEDDVEPHAVGFLLGLPDQVQEDKNMWVVERLQGKARFTFTLALSEIIEAVVENVETIVENAAVSLENVIATDVTNAVEAEVTTVIEDETGVDDTAAKEVCVQCGDVV